jgi:acetyl-CoA carboxylase biotin carboxyl carrier protein
MYKLSEIRELIKMVDQSTLQELEIQNEGYRLLIRKPNPPETMNLTPYVQQPLVQTPSIGVNQHEAVHVISQTEANKINALQKIVSPMVGTFYTASSPGDASFVTIGSKVTEKTVVCIIEAMKLMNDIEAEIKGVITEILVENGQLVEYGQPLFLVRPD